MIKHYKCKGFAHFAQDCLKGVGKDTFVGMTIHGPKKRDFFLVFQSNYIG